MRLGQMGRALRSREGDGRQLALDFGDWTSPASPKARQREALRAPPAQNLFLALVLDGEQRTSVATAGARICRDAGVKGQLMTPERLHVSLLGLATGETIAETLIADLCGTLDRLAAPAFDLELDMAADFGARTRQHAFVLTGGEGVAGAKRLRTGLMDHLFAERRQESYQPHMTLAYHRGNIETHRVTPIQWRVKDYALIHSFAGQGRYETRGRWALDG